MKEILEKRIRNKSLSKDEAKRTLLEIGQGKCNSHQIAAFLTTYMMSVVTVEELSGFRAALLNLCIAIDLKDYDPIDLCGTGGDGKDTFNISTLASFVTAGAVLLWLNMGIMVFPLRVDQVMSWNTWVFAFQTSKIFCETASKKLGYAFFMPLCFTLR